MLFMGLELICQENLSNTESSASTGFQRSETPGDIFLGSLVTQGFQRLQKSDLKIQENLLELHYPFQIGKG
jgi:hypothetical protein